MRQIKEILMTRDDMSDEEAQMVIDDVKEQMEAVMSDAAENPFGILDELEEIMRVELGLEPDYMHQLIDLF